MAILGAHMSIAGGYYKAVEAAARFGMETVQIFTKNNNQWRAKPISDEEVEKFRETIETTGVSSPLAHASYLINLASPDRELWQRSVDAFVVELQRADRLGIGHVVLHPGAFKEGGEQAGIKRIVRALNQIHRRTTKLRAQCLLETTAGQGTSIGCRFEHLAEILDGVRHPDRLGVCFDTCHVFAAGYRLDPVTAYRRTMRQFDRLVGLDRVRAFHLNDSKRPLGSRVDRHEHIGLGELGLEPFRHLLRDRRFRSIPMYLETPKGRKNGNEWDTINLAVLRKLSDSKPRR
jgi:deoxyribonuclease-4